MTFAPRSATGDQPFYWAMERYERNSKCKSMRRKDERDGRCWGQQKGAEQEARDEKEGTVVTSKVAVLAGAWGVRSELAFAEREGKRWWDGGRVVGH
ncbi:hypothetical protein COCNU_04G005730 [Cocos nucifera]|uniref:Uncharacterized protein n=1 Tax=Cocos nucifera TaxID=13894 RepID=A0A8K0I698_COCNU|nr:hypothetical protein COCNU_04G005730 [Cocos nucifera]